MQNTESTLPLTILRGEQQLGQFSEEEVREGLRSGQFLSTDFWWKAGMENWQPLDEHPEFAGLFASPAAAQPKRFCRHCGGQLSPEAVVCMQCGAAAPRQKAEGSKSGLPIFSANGCLRLVVLAVVLLVGLSVAGYYGHTEMKNSAKRMQAEADIQTLTTALRTYEMVNRRLPTTEQGLKALVVKPAGITTPWRQLLEEVPLDPWGRPYVYRNPGRHNTKGFDLYSLGRSGIDGNEDNIGRK